VAELLPELVDPHLPDESTLEQRRFALREELGRLRARQEQLESEWGLANLPLDVASCEAELTAAIRERAVKQQAARIVALARGSMVGRVLPTTEHNLRLLLPRLTAQRYHDAVLTEDYRLTVWDAMAGRYVAKDIFSGGTRDQFSLALRLAFALATLPQELGTSPGFIFLDEPLSAFDAPRTEALIELLTTGDIARGFAQVFLISHGRTFDPARFTHYLRLHEGRVAETNLEPYTPA
jgi:exonuclease SbcC